MAPYPSEGERLGHVPPKDKDVLRLAVPRPQALGFQGALVGQQDPVAVLGAATHLQVRLFVRFSIAFIHNFEVEPKTSTWNSPGKKQTNKQDRQLTKLVTQFLNKQLKGK